MPSLGLVRNKFAGVFGTLGCKLGSLRLHFRFGNPVLMQTFHCVNVFARLYPYFLSFFDRLVVQVFASPGQDLFADKASFVRFSQLVLVNDLLAEVLMGQVRFLL